MKGLEKIPSEKNLENAYELLQGLKKISISLEKLALFLQWSRFDPRLAEILVNYIFKNWENINPIAFNESIKNQPWPATIGIIVEFVKKAVRRPTKKKFLLWSGLVTSEVEKAPWEQYFIGLRKIAGKEMFNDARFASEEYRRWGYLSRENLFNKSKFKIKYSPQVRIEILKDLLLENPRITTRQYYNSLGKSISLRQAERDVCESSLLLIRDKTKARRLVRKTHL